WRAGRWSCPEAMRCTTWRCFRPSCPPSKADCRCGWPDFFTHWTPDMQHTNRRLWALAVCALAWGAAHAQTPPSVKDYPNKPIKVVVPSPAGGPPDLILRALLPKMSATLGQPIIIENRAGAGGLVGTAYVARQPADGYTWLFTTASHVNIPPFSENVTYDPIKDLTHVTLAAQNFGQALVVNPGVEAKNV